MEAAHAHHSTLPHKKNSGRTCALQLNAPYNDGGRTCALYHILHSQDGGRESNCAVEINAAVANSVQTRVRKLNLRSFRPAVDVHEASPSTCRLPFALTQPYD